MISSASPMRSLGLLLADRWSQQKSAIGGDTDGRMDGDLLFASAAASSAYLTVSKHSRWKSARSPSLYYVVGTSVGGAGGPWLRRAHRHRLARQCRRRLSSSWGADVVAALLSGAGALPPSAVLEKISRPLAFVD